MPEYVDGGSYIDVYPISTAQYHCWMSHYAHSFPPDQADEPWDSEGGEKGIDVWYTADHGQGGTDPVSFWLNDGTPGPSEFGSDVRYYDSYGEVFFHADSLADLIVVSNAFIVWDLRPYREFWERAEVVVDTVAVGADDVSWTIDLARITSFGTEYWDHRVSYDGEPNGALGQWSFASIQAGELTGPDGLLKHFPLRQIPSGLVGLRFGVLHHEPPPVNNNTATFLVDDQAAAGIPWSAEVAGAWHSAVVYSLPALRLYRGDGEDSLEVDAHLPLSGAVRFYQEREVTYHRARLRKGGA